MPRGFLWRCINYPSERSSIVSYNTAYTSTGPALEKKYLLDLQKRYLAFAEKPKESQRKEPVDKEIFNIEEMLERYPWYHGNIGRLSAEQLVLRQGESCRGTFVVRHSVTRKGQHVITFNSNDRARHIQFQFISTGECKIKHLWFDTIFDMLEHFQTHAIPTESTRSSDVTLTSYVNKLDNNCRFIVSRKYKSAEDPPNLMTDTK